MTDKADRTVVLAELLVAFSGTVIISDWVHGVDHSPVQQFLLPSSVKTLIMVSPPAWTGSAVPEGVKEYNELMVSPTAVFIIVAVKVPKS